MKKKYRWLKKGEIRRRGDQSKRMRGVYSEVSISVGLKQGSKGCSEPCRRPLPEARKTPRKVAVKVSATCNSAILQCPGGKVCKVWPWMCCICLRNDNFVDALQQ